MDRTGASEKIAEKAAPVIDAIPDGIKEGASKAFTFAGDQYKQWAEKHPEAARNLENIKDTASGAATIEGAASLPGLVKGGVKLAEDVAKNTVNVAKGMGDDVVKTAAKVTDKVADTVGNPTELFSGPKDLDKSIEVGLSKGIRPSVSGKSTFAQNDAYMSKGKDAVKTIVERKGGLKLVDDAGETVELPQNLKQFSEAIEQTKSGIFKEYDDLAKQAGQAGAKVELAPIADELEKTAKDSVLKTHAPGAAGYAEERAAALRAAGSHTTEDAQRAIQLYNKSLEAFYRNPTYDTASRAAIDAMIANKMRISLDDVVEQFTDIPGYQALKNKYGALKTIEADVTKRALVDARKNMKGLLDFTDIASGGELVSSLLTMNPASFAKAATMKGLAQYFKYLNDPNTAIKNMFKNVDKAIHGVTPK
jgi:hypothetical protein